MSTTVPSPTGATCAPAVRKCEPWYTLQLTIGGRWLNAWGGSPSHERATRGDNGRQGKGRAHTSAGSTTTCHCEACSGRCSGTTTASGSTPASLPVLAARAGGGPDMVPRPLGVGARREGARRATRCVPG